MSTGLEERLRLVHAIEANTREFFLSLGKAGGGSHRTGPVEWIIGGSPIALNNAVIAAALEEASADAAILASRQALAELQIGGSWVVGPSMKPPDLPKRLVDGGFRPDGVLVGMARRLTDLPSASAIGSLSIEEVAPDGQLGGWASVVGNCFGLDGPQMHWMGASLDRQGWGPGANWRHFVGRIDGRAVASSSLFIAAGVAGIYFVGTLPEARGRGIGATMTQHAVRQATDYGVDVAVLSATPMGLSVYQGLGFTEQCRFGIYTWTPAAAQSSRLHP